MFEPKGVRKSIHLAGRQVAIEVRIDHERFSNETAFRRFLPLPASVQLMDTRVLTVKYLQMAGCEDERAVDPSRCRTIDTDQ